MINKYYLICGIILLLCGLRFAAEADNVIVISDEVRIEQDQWRWIGISVGFLSHDAGDYDHSVIPLVFALGHQKYGMRSYCDIEVAFISDLSSKGNDFSDSSNIFGDEMNKTERGLFLNGAFAIRAKSIALGAAYVLRSIKATADGSRTRPWRDTPLESFDDKYSALIHGPALFLRTDIPLSSRPAIQLSLRMYLVPHSNGYIEIEENNDIGGNVYLASSGEIQWEFRPGVAIYIRGDYEDLLNENNYASKIFSLGARRQF